MADDYKEQPHHKGFMARLAGDPLTANPHPITSQAWRDWTDGWNDQDQHLNARDEALDQIGWFGR